MNIVKEEREIILWHEFDGPGETSREAIEEIARIYSERNDIKVTVKALSLDDVVKNMTKPKAGCVLPHIACVPSDFVYLIDGANYSKVPENICKDIVEERFIELVKIQNELYAVPFVIGNNLVMYYNKELLLSAPKTWDELKSVSPMLSHKGIVASSTDMERAYWLIPFLSAFGVWPIDDELKNINLEKIGDAVSYIDSLFKEGVLTHNNSQYEMLDQFIEGRVASIINGEWMYDHLNNRIGDRLGVCAIPKVGENKCRSTVSTMCMVFPNNSLESEQNEQIIGFAKFMLSKESQLIWANKVYRTPANLEVQNEFILNCNPIRRDNISIMKDSHVLDVKNLAIWGVLEAGLTEFLKNDKTIEKVISAIKKEVIKSDKNSNI